MLEFNLEACQKFYNLPCSNILSKFLQIEVDIRCKILICNHCVIPVTVGINGEHLLIFNELLCQFQQLMCTVYILCEGKLKLEVMMHPTFDMLLILGWEEIEESFHPLHPNPNKGIYFKINMSFPIFLWWVQLVLQMF